MNAIELFTINVQRAEDLLKVHKMSFPRGRPVSTGEPADLLRAIVVFEVAALDSYIHKKIVDVVDGILNREKRLPDRCVSHITRSIKQNELSRELMKLALHTKPMREILKRLEKSLAVQTFQKPEQIEEAFQMMEIRDPWTKIDQLVKPRRGRKKKGRKPQSRLFISKIAERRNAIVHEGDIYLGKKYHGKPRPIARSDVERGSDKLKRIVEAIENIA
jgi:hypothetical protein